MHPDMCKCFFCCCLTLCYLVVVVYCYVIHSSGMDVYCFTKYAHDHSRTLYMPSRESCSPEQLTTSRNKSPLFKNLNQKDSRTRLKMASTLTPVPTLHTVHWVSHWQTMKIHTPVLLPPHKKRAHTTSHFGKKHRPAQHDNRNGSHHGAQDSRDGI